LITRIPKEIQKIIKKRDNAEKYDYLLALIVELCDYPDFEDSAALQSLLTKLGNACLLSYPWLYIY